MSFDPPTCGAAHDSLHEERIRATRTNKTIFCRCVYLSASLRSLGSQEMQGSNIFDLVESGSHERLRRLLEENLGSVSKEAISSALTHQGITFEALLARSEKAKEEGDANFFSASGESPRLSGSSTSGGASSSCGNGARSRSVGGEYGASFSGSGSGSISGGGGTELDGWESEMVSSACESSSRTNSFGGSSEVDSGGAYDGQGVKRSRPDRRPLPPLSPAAFSAGRGGGAPKYAGGSTTGSGSGDTDGGSTRIRPGASSSQSPSSGSAGKTAGGAGAPSRLFGIETDPSVSSSSSNNSSVVNVDRDLQSKINAFTDSQKVWEYALSFFLRPSNLFVVIILRINTP